MMKTDKKSVSVKRFVKLSLGLLVPAFIINVLFINAGTVDRSSSEDAALRKSSSPREWRVGRILVKPTEGLSDSDLEAILSLHQGKSKGRISHLPVHIVSVPEQAEEAIVRALSNNPKIDFAELDMKIPLAATLVDDPRFANQWHLSLLQTPAAWDSAKGDGIIIAILDTGIDPTHPDLAAKLVPGWNAVDGSTATSDLKGHGTSVAGTAAAITNNGVGVAGIAWNAKIMPIRVSNTSDGYAYWSDMARGLTWAADNGAKVANMSYGVTESSSVNSAAQYLNSKGGVAVAAAGNNGTDPGLPDSPYIITVSATTSSDTKASWSNYGQMVDVAAPGASVLTTGIGGTYGNASGTSFASPAVAGVVALIMSANPALGPKEVETVLENSAIKLTGVEFDPYYGHGRVNAAAAVELAIATPARDSIAPSVAFLSPSSGSQLAGMAKISVSATDNISVAQVSLSVGSKLIGSSTTAPFSFEFDTTTFSDGTYQIKAIAEDDSGNQATTAISVTIKNNVIIDNQSPIVTIKNPVPGSTVGSSVSVSVSATDDVKVARTQLLIDGKIVASSSTGTLNYKWNTKKAARGSHTLEAIATDTSNKTSRVSIQVMK